jgi:hypothetical protein
MCRWKDHKSGHQKFCQVRVTWGSCSSALRVCFWRFFRPDKQSSEVLQAINSTTHNHRSSVSMSHLFYLTPCHSLSGFLQIVGSHAADRTCDCIRRYSWGRTYRPPCSVELIRKDVDVKQAVTSWLQTHNKDWLYARPQSLVPQWDKCLNVTYDSVKVWCVPSVTRVPSIRQSENQSVCCLVFWNFVM